MQKVLYPNYNSNFLVSLNGFVILCLDSCNSNEKNLRRIIPEESTQTVWH